MSFHLGSQHCRAEVPRQQSIRCSVGTVRQFLARNTLCHFKWKGIAEPYETNHPANGLLHAEVRGMIVSSVNDGNARLAIHEVIEKEGAIRSNAGASESLFNQWNDHRDRLRTTDQRISEFARVHFHELHRS